MLSFVFMIFIVALGAIIYVVADNDIIPWDWSWLGTALIAFGLVFLMLMTINAGVIGITADAIEAANIERYEALMYKIESGVCYDDFGLINKEIIDDIQAWNEDLACKKTLEQDKWIGAFYPNIYSDFDFIEYEKIYTGEME